MRVDEELQQLRARAADLEADAAKWKRASERLASEPGYYCDDCFLAPTECGVECDWDNEDEAHNACKQRRLEWALEEAQNDGS